jgi:hypothetical protein
MLYNSQMSAYRAPLGVGIGGRMKPFDACLTRSFNVDL